MNTAHQKGLDKSWFSGISSYILPGLGAAVTLLISYLVTTLTPGNLTPVVILLVDIIFFFFSAWLGVAYSTKQAEKRGGENWIPIAEASCKKLLTMKADLESIQRRQGQIVDKLAVICPSINTEQHHPLKAAMQMRCEVCGDNLAYLKNQVQNNYSDWNAFIQTNCSEVVCQSIHNRLDSFRTEIETWNGGRAVEPRGNHAYG